MAAQPSAVPETVKLIVCDDDRGYRKFVVRHFTKDATGYSVKSVSRPEEVLDLLRDWPADVVLYDLYYDKVARLEGARLIRQASPTTKVVALTYSSYDGDVRQALETDAAGAFDAYLTKDSDAEQIENAVNEVLHGRRYIDPIVAPALLTNARIELSASECIVLQGLADGKSENEIALQLPRNTRTRKPVGGRQVRRLEESARGKLGADTTHQAIATALRRHLIR